MVSPDPTNASNLSSGDVPLAQLGNAPATDTTTLEDDIALLGFKVAVAGTMAKYNLVDQTEDAFMDATGIDASASTGEERDLVSNYYSVGNAHPTATGGTITTDGLYTIHSFLSGTSNYVNGTTQPTDVLVVAGGGGAGSGGGGAGGMLTSAAMSVVGGTFSVTVGAGGSAGGGYIAGGNGADSIFSTLTATGGGGGGRNDAGYGQANGPLQGGSGGGAGATSTPSLAAAPGTVGQGNAGGNNAAASAPGYAGSGGGGAGAVGVNGSGTTNGSGGIGLQNDYRTGVNTYYAGGGAGYYSGSTGGVGGLGGGGGNGAAGGNGTVNTGGGAGAVSGVGGSGIVVLRRLTARAVPASMVLQSNSTTAESTATKGDLVMTYTNGDGTAVLNTDITAEFSADNGSNWTSMTLEAQGTTGSASPHIIVTAHNVTADVSGTGMKYRIKTFNQGAAKETRIQAVSLGWS
jgi:hypothetical protein